VALLLDVEGNLKVARHVEVGGSELGRQRGVQDVNNGDRPFERRRGSGVREDRVVHARGVFIGRLDVIDAVHDLSGFHLATVPL
jgi:hypothetical protein